MMTNVSVTVLERPIYGMAQVDRLLSLPPGTARRWIDGYDRARRHYEPVVRAESTGEDVVTWGEFVEARLLAGYRRKSVPLLRMRPVVVRLRHELDTPYPLAQARLWVADRELVNTIEEDAAIARPLRLVEVVRTGQLRLAAEAEDFFNEVEWDDGYAARLRPLGMGASVTFDPLHSFGEPTVGVVRTDVVAEEIRAGTPPDRVAASYGLSLRQVNDAIRFELGRVA